MGTAPPIATFLEMDEFTLIVVTPTVSQYNKYIAGLGLNIKHKKTDDGLLVWYYGLLTTCRLSSALPWQLNPYPPLRGAMLPTLPDSSRHYPTETYFWRTRPTTRLLSPGQHLKEQSNVCHSQTSVWDNSTIQFVPLHACSGISFYPLSHRVTAHITVT